MTKTPFASPRGNTDILFVGALYQDTILTVDGFPLEDAKKSAESVTVRRGGNVGNTLEVLSQFPKVNLWLMAAMASKDVAAYVNYLSWFSPRSPLPLPPSSIIQ